MLDWYPRQVFLQEHYQSLFVILCLLENCYACIMVSFIITRLAIQSLSSSIGYVGCLSLYDWIIDVEWLLEIAFLQFHYAWIVSDMLLYMHVLCLHTNLCFVLIGLTSVLWQVYLSAIDRGCDPVNKFNYFNLSALPNELEGFKGKTTFLPFYTMQVIS